MRLMAIASGVRMVISLTQLPRASSVAHASPRQAANSKDDKDDMVGG
jgi:hypothetical protein